MLKIINYIFRLRQKIDNDKFKEKECEFEGIQAVSNIIISPYENDEYQGEIKKKILMLVFNIISKDLNKE